MEALVFVALCAMMGTNDAAVSVRVQLEPPVVPFHRQARYTIVAEGPADAAIKLPDMVDHFGGLNVYGTPEYRADPLKDGRVRISETYTLDPIFVGDYPIAPATITWADGGDAVLPSPALRVRELTEEEIIQAEQFDSALAFPPLDSPTLTKRWQTWTLLALAAAVAAIVWYWRRKPAREAADAPRRTAWEVAYDRLRTLDQRQYPKQGKYGPYYVDLSAILRYYIEDRFHVHAPEQTTPEFLSEISDKGVLREDHEQLVAGFLRHCDRVKFAQYQPTIDEMERSFTQVLQFVDETVPQPVQQEAA